MGMLIRFQYYFMNDGSRWEMTVNSTLRNVFQYLGLSNSQCEPTYPIPNGTIQLNRYGDSTMTDTPTIYLYSGEYFTGIEYNSVPSSNENISASSYWFTGSRYVWLLYPSSDYSGDATCLEPSIRVKQLGWGQTYGVSEN